ncbi:hypothetical protein Lal_00042432 [Lupinus albus]|nr:hypothetical protein Lal_00042417 [Lupinus albus]KAF1867964.1 hypothetical protein Lal_00042432 [Lupinus albus]
MDSKTLNQSPPFIRFYSLRFRSGDRLTTMEARNFDVVYAVASFVQLSVWDSLFCYVMDSEDCSLDLWEVNSGKSLGIRVIMDSIQHLPLHKLLEHPWITQNSCI